MRDLRMLCSATTSASSLDRLKAAYLAILEASSSASTLDRLSASSLTIISASTLVRAKAAYLAAFSA